MSRNTKTPWELMSDEDRQKSRAFYPDELLISSRQQYPRASADDLNEEFVNRVIKSSRDLNVPYNDLMSVMAMETGGTFSPSIKAPNSSATGLIQFMNSPENFEHLKAVGELSHGNIGGMPTWVQMDVVDRYLKKNMDEAEKNPLKRLYKAILAPNARGESWYKSGSAAYNSNKSLDLDKDGVISGDEAIKSIENRGLITRDPVLPIRNYRAPGLGVSMRRLKK